MIGEQPLERFAPDVFVSDPHNHVTVCFEPRRASSIVIHLLGGGVSPAVELEDQLETRAIEVDDEPTEWVLTLELEAEYSLPAKQ